MPFLKRKNPRKSKKRNLPNFQEAKRDPFLKKKEEGMVNAIPKKKKSKKKTKKLT